MTSAATEPASPAQAPGIPAFLELEITGFCQRAIQFIGGEPAIAPHFPRLMRRAHDAGLNVNVYSNLVRVTPALRDLLTAPGVSLSTSWYAADPAVHAQITGSRTGPFQVTARLAG